MLSSLNICLIYYVYCTQSTYGVVGEHPYSSIRMQTATHFVTGTTRIYRARMGGLISFFTISVWFVFPSKIYQMNKNNQDIAKKKHFQKEKSNVSKYQSFHMMFIGLFYPCIKQHKFSVWAWLKWESTWGMDGKAIITRLDTKFLQWLLREAY